MLGTLAAASQPSGGGNLAGVLLPLVLMGGLFYFVLMRPQRSRSRAAAQLLESLEVGDEVMTAGGIFGTIKEIDEDEGILTVEIAPGIDVRMLKRAIAQKLIADDEYEEEEPEEEADHQS